MKVSFIKQSLNAGKKSRTSHDQSSNNKSVHIKMMKTDKQKAVVIIKSAKLKMAAAQTL